MTSKSSGLLFASSGSIPISLETRRTPEESLPNADRCTFQTYLGATPSTNAISTSLAS